MLNRIDIQYMIIYILCPFLYLILHIFVHRSKQSSIVCNYAFNLKSLRFWLMRAQFARWTNSTQPQCTCIHEYIYACISFIWMYISFHNKMHNNLWRNQAQLFKNLQVSCAEVSTHVHPPPVILCIIHIVYIYINIHTYYMNICTFFVCKALILGYRHFSL